MYGVCATKKNPWWIDSEDHAVYVELQKTQSFECHEIKLRQIFSSSDYNGTGGLWQEDALSDDEQIKHCDDTSLHNAVTSYNTKMAALLVSQGADPLCVNEEGKTPLDLVAYISDQECRFEMYKILFKAK